eukprot:TRINITY_DN57536_c0_g1_i1.p1 TRINITY_DN57536_c0_g1~~TRINITY_DN57536_c0_g1_i1.p1  ORF type:complete len:292 (+),score=111.26 TRINITY_DN57536_c0_g1_i1:71-877(+)
MPPGGAARRLARRPRPAPAGSAEGAAEGSPAKRRRADAPGKVPQGPPPYITFILESAGVAITDVGKKQNVVLCHDTHGTFLDVKGQPAHLFRPDIVHQVMLAIFDTPLCKEGRVRVLINTIKNKCIEVSHTTRIPRTFRRFAGLMSQLIDQGKVVNPETGQDLFKVQKYPVRTFIPEGRKVFGLCNSLDVTPVSARSLVDSLLAEPPPPDQAAAYFVVSCRDNAAWPDEEEGFGEYVTDRVAITQYETAPVHLVAKVCDAFEQRWGIW